MSELNKLGSQLVWRIELLQDFDVPSDVYAVTVTLRVPARDWALSGYVVFYNEAAGETRHLMQNDFRLEDFMARDLLCRIVEGFRSKLSDLGGGLGVNMERDRWLAWLNGQYPGQAIRIEAQLLLRKGLT